MIVWIAKHPRLTPEHLGLIPSFFSEDDPRPAREQLDANYAHGGGWNPLSGFKLSDRGLEYPGDPPMRLLAEAKLRDETLRLYDCDWLMIVQPDGSWEVSRVD